MYVDKCKCTPSFPATHTQTFGKSTPFMALIIAFFLFSDQDTEGISVFIK